MTQRNVKDMEADLYNIFVRLGESIYQRTRPKLKEFMTLLSDTARTTEDNFDQIEKAHKSLAELNRRGARRREPPRI